MYDVIETIKKDVYRYVTNSVTPLLILYFVTDS